MNLRGKEFLLNYKYNDKVYENMFRFRKRTEKELDIRKSIDTRIKEYYIDLFGSFDGYDFYTSVGVIDYINGNYLSYRNMDREKVEVFYLGQCEDEAFHNAVFEYLKDKKKVLLNDKKIIEIPKKYLKVV